MKNFLLLVCLTFLSLGSLVMMKEALPQMATVIVTAMVMVMATATATATAMAMAMGLGLGLGWAIEDCATDPSMCPVCSGWGYHRALSMWKRCLRGVGIAALESTKACPAASPMKCWPSPLSRGSAPR